jgi:hypothetical protein
MARINIEETWWNDPRKQHLTRLLNSEIVATGAFYTAARLAQTYWLNGRALIPEKIWKAFEFQAQLIEAGLAEVRDAGVYVVGSCDAFDWLELKKEAGKKGGLARASKLKQTQAKPSKLKQTQPSSSISISSSFSSSGSNSISNSSSFTKDTGATSANAEGTVETGPIKNPTGYFISAYVAAYQQRYGETARPHLSGKVQGQIKRFLAETPLERACELINKYCQMQDQWFSTKAHDFGTFVENQSKISLALDTGQEGAHKGGQIDWDKLGKELGFV